MLDPKTLKMVTLAENTTTNPFTLAEWGLSIYVETPDRRILMDTGQGHNNIITHNADVIGVDLNSVDCVLLSHSHQDHTGGLKNVLERRKYIGKGQKTDIYCHPQALEEAYVQTPTTGAYWYFGLSHSVRDLERLGANFITSREPVWLTEDIVTSGEIPMTNEYEEVGTNFGVRRNGDIVMDDQIIDEQSLFIKTTEGLIVVLGCAHRGIINTIHFGQKLTGMDDVLMVVGGTHLAGVPQSRMDFTVSELRRVKVGRIGVSHCTGMAEAAYLYGEFGDEHFFFNNVSTTISF